MSHTTPETATSPDTVAQRRPRLLGTGAGRGLALIGLISIHILPAVDPDTSAPTARWTLFAGRSAALSALLAGVGLAFTDLATTPGATLAQPLLTGTYPALPYLTYLLAGLGRLHLSDVQLQAILLLVGAGVAAAAWLTCWVLILQAGGYDQLMTHTPALNEDQIDDVISWAGPRPCPPPPGGGC